MGEVYLGYSPAGDPVAVKLIREDCLNTLVRARFEKEALIARTVVGTNRVARFLDAEPLADRPWLAMEYIPGATLQAWVDANGPLPDVLVASLGALLAEGLAAVHAAELLHRDLKPQNIILGDYGPVIIDFGLAAFTDAGLGSLSRRGMIVGTVRCMPPEQAEGNPQVTTAADVYALGTVLLYAATGHYPYDGPTWQSIVLQVANPALEPDLTGLPGALRPLITAMFAHEATDRPTLDTVTSTCADLLRLADVHPVVARRALIDRTTAPSSPRVVSTLTLSIEDALSDLAGGSADEGFRLDQEETPASSTASDAAESPKQASDHERPAPRSSPQARIAAQLRDAYAVGAPF
ncbi:serine/threonine-protein kinase [Cryptosporangium arvum]